jgi:hypothetical protein
VAAEGITVGTSAPGARTAESSGGDVATVSATAPTAEPPTLGDAATAEGVSATWRSGQVIALWSVNEIRNAWANVQGVGWKKIYNGKDGAFLALTTLAAQARQTGRSINFREEADGMIYEIYLW